MAKTQWELIKQFEDLLDEKPLNHRAGQLLITFIEKLFQQGLFDRDIVHWLCESTKDRKVAEARWVSLHEYIGNNEAAIKKAAEKNSQT
jgi:hypothetical protein